MEGYGLPNQGNTMSNRVDPFTNAPELNYSPTAYIGPAPDPENKIDMTGFGLPDNDPGDNDNRLIIGEENLPQNPFQPPEFTQVPAPPQPDLVAQLAELQQANGRLINEFGSLKAASARQMAEMQMAYQANLARLQAPQPIAAPTFGAQPGFGQQTPDIDPEATVTFGQFAQALGNYHNWIGNQVETVIQSRLLRAQNNISPTDEQAAIARYPYINDTPEPQRSALLAQAVQLLRQEVTQPSQTAPAPPPVLPQAQSLAPMPPPQPYNMTAQAPAIDHKPVDVRVQLRAEWEKAMAITDTTQRRQALKNVQAKAMQAQGINPLNIHKAAWIEEG